MKTYTIIYAQDIPHYGCVELEAESDEKIVEAARAYWEATELDPVDDPDWSNPVSKRIVEITDEAGGTIAHDVRLDNYSLERGTDEEIAIRDAAPELLRQLEHLAGACEHFAPEILTTEARAVIAKARRQP